MAFGKKSFATITSGLVKMVQDLRAHALDKTAEADAHKERIEDLHAAHKACLDEADRYHEVAQNIAALVGE